MVRPLMALADRAREATLDLIAFVRAGQEPVPRLLQLLHAASTSLLLHTASTSLRFLTFVNCHALTALPPRLLFKLAALLHVVSKNE
jgi:hypothetical protein